jgi:hypothetical protein
MSGADLHFLTTLPEQHKRAALAWLVEWQQQELDAPSIVLGHDGMGWFVATERGHVGAPSLAECVEKAAAQEGAVHA